VHILVAVASHGAESEIGVAGHAHYVDSKAWLNFTMKLPGAGESQEKSVKDQRRLVCSVT